MERITEYADGADLIGLGVVGLLGLACAIAGVVLAVLARRPSVSGPALVATIAVVASPIVSWICATRWADRFGAELAMLPGLVFVWPAALLLAAIAALMGTSIARELAGSRKR